MGLHGALLVMPYLMAVLCFPTYVLTLFYGKRSSASARHTAELMCCSYVFVYSGLLLSTVLSGLGHPHVYHTAGQRISAMHLRS